MSKILKISIVLVLLAGAPALAEYINLQIKWSQPIGYDGTTVLGVDLHSDHTANLVVADDFECDDQDPIVAVRWWGSYIGDSTQKPIDHAAGPFDISFHLHDQLSHAGIGMPLANNIKSLHHRHTGFYHGCQLAAKNGNVICRYWFCTCGKQRTAFFLDLTSFGCKPLFA